MTDDEPNITDKSVWIPNKICFILKLDYSEEHIKNINKKLKKVPEVKRLFLLLIETYLSEILSVGQKWIAIKSICLGNRAIFTEYYDIFSNTIYISRLKQYYVCDTITPYINKNKNHNGMNIVNVVNKNDNNDNNNILPESREYNAYLDFNIIFDEPVFMFYHSLYKIKTITRYSSNV